MTGRQQRWCGQECVNDYLIRKGGNEARAAVFKRDRGLCHDCGLDTNAVREQIKAADRRAFEIYLAEWNAENPDGVTGSYLEPSKYVHLGYAKHRAPKTQVGFRPGAMWKAKKPTGWRQRWRLWEIVREHRIGTLKDLGQDVMVKWWWRKTYWDADHVVGVAEGGGACGLGNYQTLCLGCHVKKSGNANRARSKKVRKISRMPSEVCMDECVLGNPEHELCLGCLRYRKRVLRRTG